MRSKRVSSITSISWTNNRLLFNKLSTRLSLLRNKVPRKDLKKHKRWLKSSRLKVWNRVKLTWSIYKINSNQHLKKFMISSITSKRSIQTYKVWKMNTKSNWKWIRTQLQIHHFLESRISHKKKFCYRTSFYRLNKAILL